VSAEPAGSLQDSAGSAFLQGPRQLRKAGLE
jgi:hypothetical protein